MSPTLEDRVIESTKRLRSRFRGAGSGGIQRPSPARLTKGETQGVSVWRVACFHWSPISRVSSSPVPCPRNSTYSRYMASTPHLY